MPRHGINNLPVFLVGVKHFPDAPRIAQEGRSVHTVGFYTLGSICRPKQFPGLLDLGRW
jgi:hypothetical protein